MGKKQEPQTVSVEDFLCLNNPPVQPVAGLLSPIVNLKMNSFQLVKKYLGIKYQEIECKRHKFKGLTAHEAWVDLTAKWNCGIVSACANKRRHAELACCAKILAIFGRIDLAKRVFQTERKFPLFVGFHHGNRIMENPDGAIPRVQDPSTKQRLRIKPLRAATSANEKTNPRRLVSEDVGHGKVAKRAKIDEKSQKIYKETKCPFLTFLNIPNADCGLWQKSTLEMKVVQNCLEIQKSKNDAFPLVEVEDCTAVGCSNFVKFEACNSSTPETVHFLNMLPMIETIDVFTNFEPSTNLHSVKISVNSLYSFYGHSCFIERALQNAKSRAIEVLQNLNQGESMVIPSDSYTDVVLLLKLVEDRTGMTADNLPLTFEFDFENKNWKAALKFKDSNVHYSDLFTSRSDAINDVLYKYLKNRYDVRCC